MTASDPSKKLHALLQRIAPAAGADIASTEGADHSGPATRHAADAVIAELVRSFFIYESGVAAANAALDAIHSSLADYNELRICFPHELARIVGAADPAFEQRALRLRSTLNDIYRREHEISLLHLTTLSKRDARAYLDSLDGTPPFVAARVALLALGAHAFPVDFRLTSLLLTERAIPADLEPTSPAQIASWIEHQIRADDARQAYLNMELWADQQPKPTPSRAGGKKAAATSDPKGGNEGGIGKVAPKSAPKPSHKSASKPTPKAGPKPSTKGTAKADGKPERKPARKQPRKP